MTRGKVLNLRRPGYCQHQHTTDGIPGRIPVPIKRCVFEDVLSTFTPVFASRPAGATVITLDSLPPLHLAAPVAPGFYLAGLCAFPVQPLFRFISR